MRFNFNQSRFGAIFTLGNEYDNREPLVELYLNAAASYNERNASSIMMMFSELNPTIFRYGLCPAYQYGLRFNGNVLRQVIDILFKNNQINASDRSQVEDHIRTFEKSMERRGVVADELNNTQKEIIEMILSPYFDGIIDQVSNLSLAIKLCGIGMCDTPLNNGDQETKNFIVIKFMRARGINDAFEALVTDKIIRQEIYDCIWQVWRIYSQAERLDDTFLKLGPSLPNIKSQRENIARTLFKSVNNKLSSAENSFDEVIETATALLKAKYLNEDIISEIQNPRTLGVKEVCIPSTQEVTHQTELAQESSYIVQNTLLHGLFLERQSRRVTEPPAPQNTNKP